MYRPQSLYSQPKSYISMSLPKKFPEDIQCILRSSKPDVGSLYISNIEAAQNPTTIIKLKIGAILSCAKGHQLSHSPKLVPHYKYIPTLDDEQCQISAHFEEAADFISQNLKKTNVLVHCIAGVSRSVSMVIAYFIREHEMLYQDAYHLVKSKRRIIHPNDGFVKQLKKYCRQKKNKRQKYLKETAQKENLRSITSPSHQNSRNYFYPSSKHNQVPYQSIQLTPKVQRVTKEDSLDIRKSNTNGYFTPKKATKSSRQTLTIDTTQRKYEIDSKSANIERHSVPIEDRRNFDKNPKCQIPETVHSRENFTQNEVSIQKEVYSSKNYYFPGANCSKDFGQMNKQLNQKIELIRRKYENERQKLLGKYQAVDSNKNSRKRAQFSQQIMRKSFHNNYIQERVGQENNTSFYTNKYEFNGIINKNPEDSFSRRLKYGDLKEQVNRIRMGRYEDRYNSFLNDPLLHTAGFDKTYTYQLRGYKFGTYQ